MAFSPFAPPSIWWAVKAHELKIQSAKESAGKTDAQRADELHARLAPLLREFGAILDEAKREGLSMSFEIVTDAFGRSRPEIQIVKPL